MAKAKTTSARLGRRQLLRAASAVGAYALVPTSRARAEGDAEGWSAVATFIEPEGGAVDPMEWRTGDAELRQSAVLTIDTLAVPARPEDAPRRLDVDVCCGPKGEQRFHAWTWEAGDASDGSRALRFVAPVSDSEGLRFELSVDGGAPLSLQLHAGQAPGHAKLRRGAYEIELHRMGSGCESTRLRISIDAM